VSTDSVDRLPPAPADFDAGPLGLLPRLSHRQVGLERRLARASAEIGMAEVLSWLGESLAFGVPEVQWRGSGLKRPGLIAHLAWPRLATRLGLGVEPPLAHALVDLLLGYERLIGEEHLQVTPVEWGIATYVLARTLARLAEHPGPLGAWDLVLDRVGPDPFVPAGLGPILTLRWPAQVGAVAGSVRLWVPEPLAMQWLSTPPPPPGLDPKAPGRLGALAGAWVAVAGRVSMPRGLGRLRVGGVLPIDGFPLKGTVASPAGPVELSSRDADGRCWFPAEPSPMSGGGRLTLTGPLCREPRPREALPVSSPNDSPATEGVIPPTDVPVTLAVELGRVSLTLSRVADLKPGDVIELGRHAREPVELTSNGRLVARGELVQIETELGVRVTSVFL
jgi:flagellar motor switch protein FliN